MIAIDIKCGRVESAGTAYYRIDSDFRDFLLKCQEKHRIVGFEWDDGEFNFGVILAKKPPEHK